MNEQRQQAYLNFIQRLLNCPTNDEFQETLAAFGGGAIVSGVVTGQIDKPFAPQINFKYPVHPLVSSLLWSVLATAIFGIVAWWVTQPKPNQREINRSKH